MTPPPPADFTNPHPGWPETLARDLSPWNSPALQRRLRVPPPGLIDFSHNDYLGISQHPALRQAAIDSLTRIGFGIRAARLLGGHSEEHHALEAKLAAFKQTEAALVFPTGYAVPLGVIPAVVGSADFIVLDRFAHACLFDAARLSGATVRVFPHQDSEAAAEHLAWIRSHHSAQARILLVTESLFSMDGDLAPLREFCDIKDRYGAWLFVDEAHATGVHGRQGRGWIDQLELNGRIEIQMGTLSKALGTSGGFVAGPQSLIDLLLHRARSFLFTTATPPALAAAARQAIEIVQSPEGDQLRNQLTGNRLALLRQLPASVHLQNPATAILPWILHDETRAMQTATRLEEKGFRVGLVRHPTVPPGQARLRISLSANHSPAQIDGLAQALAEVAHD